MTLQDVKSTTVKDAESSPTNPAKAAGPQKASSDQLCVASPIIEQKTKHNFTGNNSSVDTVEQEAVRPTRDTQEQE